VSEPRFSDGSTEKIEFMGETITIWRTFEDSGRGTPKRRWHFDISRKWFSEPPGFNSREAGLSKAKWFIMWTQWQERERTLPDEKDAAAVNERAERLRERLELVTPENGYAPAEVEMAKRMLAELGE
jgi:hypothetical protein